MRPVASGSLLLHHEIPTGERKRDAGGLSLLPGTRVGSGDRRQRIGSAGRTPGRGVRQLLGADVLELYP